MASLVLLAIMAAALTAVLPSFASAEGNGSPAACDTGITGTGSEDSMSYTAADGDIVSGVCIKSGTNMFVDGHSGVLGNTTVDGCYTITGVGTRTVTVTRIGDGPECQGLSHIDVIVDEAPEPVGATVTIVKQGLAAGATANFTTTLGASFTATSSDTTQVFPDVEAGAYTVTEAALAGYTLTGAGCTGDTGTDSLAGGVLSFTVGAANVTCTFVNAQTQTAQYTVTTVKYLDGAQAATGSFNILFTWTAANFNGGVQDSTTIPLASGNGWQHTSAAMDAGAAFSVQEQGIDGTCGPNDAYRLVGYGVGGSLAVADDNVDSATIGALTNIQANQYIVVFNESCPTVVSEFDVTIRKYVDGVAAVEADGSFNFTANWDEPDAPAGTGNFTLEAANSFSATTSPLTAGSVYSIVENGIDATCDAGDEYRLAGFGIGADLAAALAAPPSMTASIPNLQADAFIVVRNVSCLTAVSEFDVTIRKYVDGVAAVAADGSFNFTANWDEPDAPAGSGNFTLEAANSFSATTSPLTSGSMYSIVENGIDATCDAGDEYRLAGFGVGADLAAAIAATPAATASILNLQADAFIVVWNVSCPTAPAAQYTVTTVKYLDGAQAATGSFNILFTWTAANFNGGVQDSTTIPLASGNSWQHTSAAMDAGAAFSVQEQGIDGTCGPNDAYRLLGYGMGATLDEADNGVDSATIGALTNIQANQYIVVFNVSCPTAPALGSITIVKNWVGGAGVDTSFTTSANLNVAGNSFDLTAAIATRLFASLGAGAYVFTEEDAAAWNLSSAVCTGTLTTEMLVGHALTVNLAAGESVTCTFTNTAVTAPALGSITVNKVWTGGTGVDTSFATSANLNVAGNSFNLTAAVATRMFANLGAGAYVFTEEDAAAWNLASAVCTGTLTTENLAGQALTVNLAAGENVTCTFTNVAVGVTAPFFPPNVIIVPPVNNVVIPPISGPVVTIPPSVIIPPSVSIPPSVTIPPSVSIPPSVTLPPAIVDTAFPPNIVGSAPPVLTGVGTPINNNFAVGGVTPLPPSTGNASAAPETTPLILFAGLAVAAGALAVVGFGATRRR